ncbi:hypothetical protein VTK73DRAFT_1330 [Phialemonium thermophilum]|uniref:DUF2423 domain-containing protein n=1 Tax=Phialemonium thermophilum TaxID=223376 RepID=A0ABR3XAB1_9PEZI
MAKSKRSSQVKANNRRLKAQVFGPVELARAERLSAKLLELASQPKPEKEGNDKEMEGIEAPEQKTTSSAHDDETMDIDSGAAAERRKLGRKKIEKRRSKKSSIVFPSFKSKRSTKKRR